MHMRRATEIEFDRNLPSEKPTAVLLEVVTSRSMCCTTCDMVIWHKGNFTLLFLVRLGWGVDKERLENFSGEPP
jgi:hypothetical protein